jgi:hypothetical protein
VCVAVLQAVCAALNIPPSPPAASAVRHHDIRVPLEPHHTLILDPWFILIGHKKCSFPYLDQPCSFALNCILKDVVV